MRHLQSYSSLPASPKDSSLSPLAKKLRLKPDHAVAVLNAPPGYLALLDPTPALVVTQLKEGQAYDAVQLFVKSVEELRALGSAAVRAVKPDGLLWIAYPKGGHAGGATDLPATPSWTKRDVLGEISGETGYKAVAFVKVDDSWTALRFKKG
ncbi:MAG TPA: hypothetical protein VGK85_05450 [Myxococcaceae bacterium]